MAEDAATLRDVAFEQRMSDVFGYFKELKSSHLKSTGNKGEYTSGFLGAIYSLGLSEPSPKDWHAWSAIMDTIDHNGVGTLSFEDFRFIVEQQREKIPPNRALLDAFATFELDSAGTMSLAEFKAIMKQYVSHEEEGENMISDSRIDQLLSEAKAEAFRGRIDAAKVVEAMAFKR